MRSVVSTTAETESKPITRREFIDTGIKVTFLAVLAGLAKEAGPQTEDTMRIFHLYSEFADFVEEPSTKETEDFNAEFSRQTEIRTRETYQTFLEPTLKEGYFYTQIYTSSINKYWASGVLIHRGVPAEIESLLINFHSLQGASADLEALFDTYKSTLDDGTAILIPFTKGLNNERIRLPDFSRTKSNLRGPTLYTRDGYYIDNSPYDALQLISGVYDKIPFRSCLPVDMIGISHGGTAGMLAYILWDFYQKKSNNVLPKLTHTGLYAPVNTLFHSDLLNYYFDKNTEWDIGMVVNLLLNNASCDAFTLNKFPDIGNLACLTDTERDKYHTLGKYDADHIIGKNLKQNTSEPALRALREIPGAIKLLRKSLFLFSPRQIMNFLLSQAEQIPNSDLQFLYAIFDTSVPSRHTKDLYDYLEKQGVSVGIDRAWGGHEYNLSILKIVEILRRLGY